jgi:CheY-like chemotaxis protein
MERMKRGKLTILTIDDEEADRLLIEAALRSNGVSDQIVCVDSAENAIAYLKGEGDFSDRVRYPYPSLVITDLKMPGKDGFTVLQDIKEHPRWKIIPVLVLSGSADADDVKRSYAMGASCFMRKPSEQSELRRLLKLFYDFWKECEMPEIDISGKQLPTKHVGKLGERFGPVK